MTKGIVPNAVSVLNMGSVVQPEIQVRFTINNLKLLAGVLYGVK